MDCGRWLGLPLVGEANGHSAARETVDRLEMLPLRSIYSINISRTNVA